MQAQWKAAVLATGEAASEALRITDQGNIIGSRKTEAGIWRAVRWVNSTDAVVAGPLDIIERESRGVDISDRGQAMVDTGEALVVDWMTGAIVQLPVPLCVAGPLAGKHPFKVRPGALSETGEIALRFDNTQFAELHFARPGGGWRYVPQLPGSGRAVFGGTAFFSAAKTTNPYVNPLVAPLLHLPTSSAIDVPNLRVQDASVMWVATDGTICGWLAEYDTPSIKRPFVRSRCAATAVRLPLPPDATSGIATCVNSLGMVAGEATIQGVSMACVWPTESSVPQMLPQLGAQGSQAHGMNERGQIVGVLTEAGVPRAVLWHAA